MLACDPVEHLPGTHDQIEYGGEEAALAAEVVIDQRVADAGLAGDGTRGRVGVTVGKEVLSGSGKNALCDIRQARRAPAAVIDHVCQYEPAGRIVKA